MWKELLSLVTSENSLLLCEIHKIRTQQLKDYNIPILEMRSIWRNTLHVNTLTKHYSFLFFPHGCIFETDFLIKKILLAAISTTKYLWYNDRQNSHLPLVFSTYFYSFHDCCMDFVVTLRPEKSKWIPTCSSYLRICCESLYLGFTSNKSWTANDEN